MREQKHTEPAMKFYIMKDGENIAITFTKKNAIDLIRSYQQYEDHYLLKAQFSIIRGEPEVFVSYPTVKGSRASKSAQPKTDTVRRKYTMRICGVARHYSYEELQELFRECREPFGLETDPDSFESWLRSQIESGRVIQSGADETTNTPA